MQKFRKLGFPEGKWEELKPLIQKTSEGPEGEVTSWNNEIVDIVYEIGHICTQWDVDAEGNKVCVATDPLYAVDIVWHDEVLEAFVPYLVFPYQLAYRQWVTALTRSMLRRTAWLILTQSTASLPNLLLNFKK
jgi:hypothetical protein